MAEIDEPIEVCAYDPNWSEQADRLVARIRECLGSMVIGIEHIGSTAVPGMWAKPVIDVQVAIREPRVPVAAVALSSLGFEDLGEAGIPGRRYLRRRTAAAANVHLVSPDSRIWYDNILIRDYLRGHHREALAYGEHKRSSARQANGLLTYSAAKHDFIEALLERARASVSAMDMGSVESP